MSNTPQTELQNRGGFRGNTPVNSDGSPRFDPLKPIRNEQTGTEPLTQKEARRLLLIEEGIAEDEARLLANPEEAVKPVLDQIREAVKQRKSSISWRLSNHADMAYLSKLGFFFEEIAIGSLVIPKGSFYKISW